MKVVQTKLRNVLILEPNAFNDDRGFFFESFNQNQFNQAVGKDVRFVQDNHSCSIQNVLRGLHYQVRQEQGKLLRVTLGAIFDVAVDIRKSSSTYGQWVGEIISAENKRQMWIPEGFAHGFLALTETAEVQYKTTDFWAPEYERCIAWNDPDLAIDWPLQGTPRLSAKDSRGGAFANAEVFS